MGSGREPKQPSIIFNIALRIIICAIVLIIGSYGMFTLAQMKKPPAEMSQDERPLRVETIRVEPENVPVLITGYGEVKSLNVVTIAPEVSGKVVEIHPQLELGGIISKGDILFKIDPRDYLASVNEEKAAIGQWENTIRRLERQWELDKKRLGTLRRNRELAGAEHQRIRKLFEEDKVGTRSGVDSSEQTYNSVRDQADQVSQTIELYPIQIKEAQSNLNAAQARLEMAQTRLERCVVRSPFRGRVKEVSLEANQFVSAGQQVMTLADDSLLEIQVPLNSQDARQWLRFCDARQSEKVAWFCELEPVEAGIRWTEDREGHTWKGQLHHVVKFDQQTRTLTVAIRVDAQNALSAGPRRLPLVEGMFCSVEIPGRTMKNVFRLPRRAVSFRNTVYLSADNRLKTIPVNVLRIDGEEAFVDSGLSPGDQVIVTRMVDPLENSLLEITTSDTGKERKS